MIKVPFECSDKSFVIVKHSRQKIFIGTIVLACWIVSSLSGCKALQQQTVNATLSFDDVVLSKFLLSKQFLHSTKHVFRSLLVSICCTWTSIQIMYSHSTYIKMINKHEIMKQLRIQLFLLTPSISLWTRLFFNTSSNLSSKHSWLGSNSLQTSTSIYLTRHKIIHYLNLSVFYINDALLSLIFIYYYRQMLLRYYIILLNSLTTRKQL